jgi:hypothetical protein
LKAHSVVQRAGSDVLNWTLGPLQDGDLSIAHRFVLKADAIDWAGEQKRLIEKGWAE